MSATIDGPFTAYIVEAVRTAGGRRGGRLSGWHPADLGAAVCDGLLERAKVDGCMVEDVAWGCVTQSGAQAENLGRNVVLSSRLLPDSVPAFTLDRQCGSAQQAIHCATQAVMSGTQDCVIAGGAECMSVVPMDSNVNTTWEGGPHTGDGILEAFGERTKSEYAPFGANPVKFDQFVGAELVAKKYGLTREDADAYALRSHQLAAAAASAGRFSEIVPVPCKSRPGISKGEAPKELHCIDEGIRKDASIESLGKLKPLLNNGTLTAAAASQICDGAAAVLICNERGLQRLGVKPKARIVALGLAAIDPVLMLEGPVPATQSVLAKANLKMEDIDLVEVNEAFSSIPLAWAKAFLGGDLTKVNVNGGAIARGHPMGATGAMLMSNLIGELRRRGGRKGLQTMCESGGTANATIIEVVDGARLPPPPPPLPMSLNQAEHTEVGSGEQRLMTMGRALGAVAAWKQTDVALTVTARNVETPLCLTFKDLELVSNRLARAYSFFKVQRNDFVTIALPTGAEFIQVSFACWKLGATPNNVGANLTFRERDEIVRLANPRLVVGVPSKKDPKMKGHEGYRCLPEGFAPGPNLSVAPMPDVFANVWLCATSGGSTGRPKLIALQEPSFVTMHSVNGDPSRPAMFEGFSILGGGKVNGIDLVSAPLSHNAPFHCVVQGILSASHQVMLTKFDAEFMLRCIDQYRCTFSYFVPTMMKRIWDLGPEVRKKYNMDSLAGIFHMAAPCPPWLKEAWCKWIGPEKVWELYGPTEAMAWTLIAGDEWMAHPKVAGLNLVGQAKSGKLRILDPESHIELPPGTMGEVWMRHHEGRHTYFYRGAESIRDEDGWETVGDMGMMDEQGYLYLGDRRKDMVLVGGTNVYPAEVEAALEEHPEIRSAVCVGVPDPDLGQVLHGVVYTEDKTLSTDDILSFLSARLEKKKIPRRFTWAEQHLRGEDGKVRRSEVAKQVIALLDSESKQQGIIAAPTSKL
mmetsp:Transcript_56805/g.133397  ORF Transcript_56805/g.133397 Transcript_56805/m.133397 type:complete len:977 (-) Transcript_56805:111-3041(-)